MRRGVQPLLSLFVTPKPTPSLSSAMYWLLRRATRTMPTAESSIRRRQWKQRLLFCQATRRATAGGWSPAVVVHWTCSSSSVQPACWTRARLPY